MLPIALILTVVLAAVVVGLTGYTTGTLKAGSVVRTRVQRLATSDAAMKIALEQIRTSAAACPRTGATPIYSSGVNGVSTINGEQFVVTCQRTVLEAEELGQYALIITSHGVSPNAAFDSDGTASKPRKVGGNVYLGYQWTTTSLSKSVELSGGDVYYYDASCTGKVPPAWDNLFFTEPAERGYECTTETWNSRAPALQFDALPAGVPTTTGAGVPNAAGCTVFSPGTYKTPPIIGSGTENFFEPGTYYFNFTGVFQIKSALVMGGVPGAATPPARPPGIAESAPSPTATFTPNRCAGAVSAAQSAATATNGGVTWVFAGNSQMSLEANGKLELFASGTSTPKPVNRWSIVALETATTINGVSYAASTVDPATTTFMDLKSGSSNGVVVHGGVWAPRSYVSLGNVANSANGQFMGGLIVGRLGIQASASAGNFNLSVPIQPVTQRVILKSTSGIVTTSVTGIVRSRTSPTKPGSILVQSWRVE